MFSLPQYQPILNNHCIAIVPSYSLFLLRGVASLLFTVPMGLLLEKAVLINPKTLVHNGPLLVHRPHRPNVSDGHQPSAVSLAVNY